MQPTSMLRPLASLWLLTVLLLEWTCTQSVAETSNFCARPANMDICWWNNVQKRFLRFGRGDPLIRFGKRAMDPLIRLGRGDPIIRFGRGDPLLRFGRGEPLIRFGRSFEPLIRIGRGDPIIRFGRGEPLIRFGKRGDPETDAMMKELYENNGYLRFGRNADPYLEEDMSDDDDDVDASRKRRDAEQNDETAEKTRTKRETSRNENAGFMRWGRGGSDELSAAAAEPAKTIAPGEGGYLRFGRGQNGFQRFGKRYLRFGREGEGGYLRFGKRSAESES